jgi:hypothetical protein
VDCIFIDLDIDGDKYDPKNDEATFRNWKIDMSGLLARARMIASTLIESGQANHFRVVLSGHKGLHLYLDFPTISENNGEFSQFKQGLKKYGENVMNWLDDAAGGLNIEKWVDVDASDLGRLARHPNTIHHGVNYDDTTRWCVPITIEEMAGLHIEDYLNLTESPRWPDGYERNPSTSAGNKVVQAIRNASSVKPISNSSPSKHNDGRIKKYEKNDENDKSRYKNSEVFTENENIELEDIEFLTANYPCVAAFVYRDDAFDHGNESHIMETNVIGKLCELGVPRNVMHEFLSQVPGYEKGKTDERINTILGRTYKSFNCETIVDRSPQFCLGEQCSVYNRSDELQK